jgi:4-hydroxybutyrate CoA-transferase
MKLGVVINSKKNFWPGKLVGTFCVGNKALWEFVNHNEDFVFCEVEYTNNPNIIAQNDGIISVNNALMMDLTGQAASESIGTVQYSATGGQVNFVRGAAMSKGGKSILALNSTYKDKEGNPRSRIMPMFPVGTAVSTSRNDVEYVVTEYGVAYLRYKNVRERAKAMISVAHPDFRDDLTKQARALGWL